MLKGCSLNQKDRIELFVELRKSPPENFGFV